MKNLKIADEDLLVAYTNAIRLELDEDFIQLLESEIKIREIVFWNNPTSHSDLLAVSI